MRKLNRWMIACRIEMHWRVIMRCRRAGERMIRRGEALTSEKLLRLDRKISRHGMRAMQLQEAYACSM